MTRCPQCKSTKLPVDGKCPRCGAPDPDTAPGGTYHWDPEEYSGPPKTIRKRETKYRYIIQVGLDAIAIVDDEDDARAVVAIISKAGERATVTKADADYTLPLRDINVYPCRCPGYPPRGNVGETGVYRINLCGVCGGLGTEEY